MKSFQIIYACLAFFWLLLGAASGERVFFVLFFLQIFLVLAALAINIWAALTFTFTQELSAEQTIRGQPVHLKLDIHNEKPFPFPLMRIQMAVPDPLEKNELKFNLAADAQLSFDLELNCPHRGSYVVGMTVIDFIDLYGIFRMPFDMRLLPYYREKRLLVFPRVIPLPGLSLKVSGQAAVSSLPGAVDDQLEPFATVRDYRPGDAAKLIHWKASLRQRHLLTRQFDASGEPQILLLLDRQTPGGQASMNLQTVDAGCEAAASLTRTLLIRGWPVKIISMGEARDVQTGSSLKDFQRLHRWLAQVDFNGQTPFHQFLSAEMARPHESRAILFITHEASAALLSVLRGIQRQRMPIYALFTGPAATDASFAAQIRMIGITAWIYQAGDDLSDVMRTGL